MNRIKFLSFRTTQKLHFGSDDLETRLLKAAVDFADHVLGDRVWLDDGKRSLD